MSPSLANSTNYGEVTHTSLHIVENMRKPGYGCRLWYLRVWTLNINTLCSQSRESRRAGRPQHVWACRTCKHAAPTTSRTYYGGDGAIPANNHALAHGHWPAGSREWRQREERGLFYLWVALTGLQCVANSKATRTNPLDRRCVYVPDTRSTTYSVWRYKDPQLTCAEQRPLQESCLSRVVLRSVRLLFVDSSKRVLCFSSSS
jgi:hypothetical protein